MTTHRIPLPDWRNNTRGIPVYSFDGKSMEPSAKTIEEVLDRPQTPRPGAEQ